MLFPFSVNLTHTKNIKPIIANFSFFVTNAKELSFMQHKLFVGQNNATMLHWFYYNYFSLIQPTNNFLLPMTTQSYRSTSNENKDKL